MYCSSQLKRYLQTSCKAYCETLATDSSRLLKPEQYHYAMRIPIISFAILLLSLGMNPFDMDKMDHPTHETRSVDPPPSEEPGEKKVEPDDD